MDTVRFDFLTPWIRYQIFISSHHGYGKFLFTYTVDTAHSDLLASWTRYILIYLYHGYGIIFLRIAYRKI